ncbi:MAG: outer membrane beta-barrel protein [Akkermansiaceae bacterium]|nr:outer membrane beta-barrel protein [Akkermansiaceae bacterium]
MHHKLSLGLFSLIATSSAIAGEGLYSVGAEPEEQLPLEWIVGSHLIYDDNVTPGLASEEDSLAVNPYVGATLTSITPQTVIDLYAQVGIVYYFDEPSTVDDTTVNTELGLDVYHDVSERISLTTRNIVTYELEPNYAYGYASSRQNEEHLFWSTDNSIDYSWTPRLTTRTGFRIYGTDYEDSDSLNRTVVGLYNQFRYRISPQTVGTLGYRYEDSDGDGLSSDSTSHFVTVGAEQRFNPNTIGRFQVGAQFRDVDGGDNSTSPYLEASVQSQVNSQFNVRGFVRYSIEDFDTIQSDGTGTFEYDERLTLRIGTSATYDISPRLQAFGGVDYIPTSFESGRLVSGTGTASDADEDVLNAYIGLALKITDNVEASCSYNYTNADSDFSSRDYDRSRISLGVSATF